MRGLVGLPMMIIASMVQDEVAHDAVQLLDRAMMAPDKPAADCMSAAAPASLYLAVCQDNQHSRDALPLLSGISNLTGVSASLLLPVGVLPHLPSPWLSVIGSAPSSLFCLWNGKQGVKAPRWACAALAARPRISTMHERACTPQLAWFETTVMQRAGYSVDMLGQIKEAMMGALQQDTAAISAQRCISLYLERLGCVPEAPSQRLKVGLPTGLPCTRRGSLVLPSVLVYHGVPSSIIKQYQVSPSNPAKVAVSLKPRCAGRGLSWVCSACLGIQHTACDLSDLSWSAACRIWPAWQRWCPRTRTWPACAPRSWRPRCLLRIARRTGSCPRGRPASPASPATPLRTCRTSSMPTSLLSGAAQLLPLCLRNIERMGLPFKRLCIWAATFGVFCNTLALTEAYTEPTCLRQR